MAIANIKEIIPKNQETLKKENRTTARASDFVETVDMREINRQRELNYYRNISRLPKRVNDFTFEKAVVRSSEEQEVKKKMESYCNKFEKCLKNGIGMYLFGNVGTGKTFYSLCVYNRLSSKYKIYRTTLKEIYRRIQGTFKEEKVNETVIYRDLLNADLIILDDVGKEKISDGWGKETLFEIFNLLSEEEKCLIISTNLDKEQMAEYTDTQGSDSVTDRWRRDCYPLKFDWESRRKSEKKKLFNEIFEGS